MQAFLLIGLACFLVTALIPCASTPQASADVRVAMADDLERKQNFLVITQIYYHKPEGFHVKQIDSSFLAAGGTRHITVLAVWPFLYDHVSTYAMHPAYFTDGTESDKAPSALSTVALPLLRPQSWRHMLDSGESPRGRDGGIVAAVISRHFDGILRTYLPAFDRARIKEDLRQHLPLLRELAAFAHRERVFRKPAATVRPGQGPVPLQEWDEGPLNVSLEHYRAEMDRGLEELASWLTLDQDRRAPIHDWVDNFHKAQYVYREMMTDVDRTRVARWLDKGRDASGERTLRWENRETGLHFSVKLGTALAGESGTGCSTEMTVDLNPVLGLKNNERYLKTSYPDFFRDSGGMWKLK